MDNIHSIDSNVKFPDMGHYDMGKANEMALYLAHCDFYPFRSVIEKIKNVRIPFNVDIGVGDVIVPRAEQRTIHTQLPDFEAPVIMTCSLESTIDEKI